LPQVILRRWRAYANDDIEFWIKGPNVTLTQNGASETFSTR
jgi:hypothetical protein